MRVIWLIVFYFAAALLHWWTAGHVSAHGAGPDIMLLAALAVASFCGPVMSHCFAFFCGIFVDFMGVHLFGGYALGFVLAAHGVWFLRRRMDFSGAVSQMMLAYLLTLGVTFLYWLMGVVFIGVPVASGWLGMLVSPFINGLLAPLVFYAGGRLFDSGASRPALLRR